MQDNKKLINVAGGVVIGPHAKYVVVSQGDSWSLPKGHVEQGETSEQTALREIREETGLTDIHLVSFLGEYERFQIAEGGIGENTQSRRKITMFLYTTDTEYLNPIDLDNPEAKWVSYEEAVNMLTHPKDAAFLVSVREKIQSLLAH